MRPVRLFLAGLSIGVAISALSACAALQPTPEPEYRTGTVERGSLDLVVSATGQVLPASVTRLVFDQPGIVREVLVSVGDFVSEGDVLARLDTDALEYSVSQAELNLQIAKVNYDRLFAPPSDAQIAAARASLNSAYASYQQATQGTDPHALQIAELKHQQADKAYEEAQARRDQAAETLSGDALAPYDDALKQAEINAWIATLQLNQAQQGPDQNAVAAAQAAIAQAQAKLDGLQTGPSDDQVAQAQARVDAAQLALDRARQQVDKATLRAPSDGYVVEVNVQASLPTPTTTTAITLVDASSGHVNVNVDEVDVGKIEVGQPATITLDALPDYPIQAEVTSISDTGTSTQGVVTYTVRLDLPPIPDGVPILIGMTATADVVVEHHPDVLLVPNWAIRFDRQSSAAFVSLLQPDNTLKEVEVEIGVRGETSSEVISGLEEGQTVAVNLREQINLLGG